MATNLLKQPPQSTNNVVNDLYDIEHLDNHSAMLGDDKGHLLDIDQQQQYKTNFELAEERKRLQLRETAVHQVTAHDGGNMGKNNLEDSLVANLDNNNESSSSYEKIEHFSDDDTANHTDFDPKSFKCLNPDDMKDFIKTINELAIIQQANKLTGTQAMLNMLENKQIMMKLEKIITYLKRMDTACMASALKLNTKDGCNVIKDINENLDFIPVLFAIREYMPMLVDLTNLSEKLIKTIPKNPKCNQKIEILKKLDMLKILLQNLQSHHPQYLRSKCGNTHNDDNSTKSHHHNNAKDTKRRKRIVKIICIIIVVIVVIALILLFIGYNNIQPPPKKIHILPYNNRFPF